MSIIVVLLSDCQGGNVVEKGKTFKVCSTCVNFTIKEIDGERYFYCGRLGYETKPHYSFNCWDPKPKVRKFMEKRERESR